MFRTLAGELSWQRLRRSAVDFYSKNEKIALWTTLYYLGVTYALHVWLVGKLEVVVIGLFSLSPTADTLWAEIGRSRRFFEGGWVTLSSDFRGKGHHPTNHCWYQKTRVIAVSCGIKISAVHHLVLSQYTCLTDRQTDGQTDRQTELRQQYRALDYMQSHGKTAITK